MGRPFVVRVCHFEPFLPSLIESLSEGVFKHQDSYDAKADSDDAGDRGKGRGHGSPWTGDSDGDFKHNENPIDLLRLASMINARGEGKILVRDLQVRIILYIDPSPS